METSLLAISPIDGRYNSKTIDLSVFFSEYALIKYRIHIEIKYLMYLKGLELFKLDTSEINKIDQIYLDFNIQDAISVKEIEHRTNHDVKAVEYFIKNKLTELNLDRISQFVHFGLTSQDINNTALALIIRDFLSEYYVQKLFELTDIISLFSKKFKRVPMLSRTHGQAATPTFLGKELAVFYERLYNQIVNLETIPISTKFGGAIGNLNAHLVSYPEYDWPLEMNNFIDSLGIRRQTHTTQIEHYDNLSAMFDCFKRINVILIDMCRDIWSYISMGYFNQKFKEGEVGSSTMPHKINPIDFENAEGNLMLANTLFQFLSSKLPISRLQRDLTDSTVSRNIGVACAHTVIAFKSMLRGLDKLTLNRVKINADLAANWVIIGEALQVILKREGITNGYELLKEFTRNNSVIGKEEIHNFIDELEINVDVKNEMKKISPFNYTGYY